MNHQRHTVVGSVTVLLLCVAAWSMSPSMASADTIINFANYSTSQTYLSDTWRITGTVTLGVNPSPTDQPITQGDLKSASFTISDGTTTYNPSGLSITLTGTPTNLELTSGGALEFLNSNDAQVLKFTGTVSTNETMYLVYNDHSTGKAVNSFVGSLFNGSTSFLFQDTNLSATGTSDKIGTTPMIIGNAVPEPSTFALLGIGAISMLAYAWRRRRS